MAPFIERLLRGLAVALLLITAACTAKHPNKPLGLQAGGGAGAPAPSGGAGASAASAGNAGGAGGVASDGAAKGGAHAGSGGAGAAGSAAASGGAAAGSGAMVGDAGAGSEAGASGAAGGAAGASGTAGMKPKCKSSPNQVIVLGDSYLNWVTHTFPDDLAREAGETWRMYAVGGCSLGSGGLCLIPPQLDKAIADDPNIIAAIMTGGGNDFLIADEGMYAGSSECKDRTDSPTVKVCQDVVAAALDAGKKLMQTAADAGIRDVIYLFYPHIPGGGFGGMNPNVLLDYTLPMAKELCEGAQQRTHGKLRCHFIDLVPVFDGHPDWFADDGIHENELGSAAMAKEVLKVAKAECIAQPASSDCCEP
jgi:hypothetical protein